MRLLNAHISNYRSIEDSEKFDIDPEVTCLVGKNESGKTSLLQALFRLNPVETVTPFDEDLDYPAKGSTRRPKRRGPNDLVPVLTAEFELTDDELRRVTDEIGDGALNSRRFSLTKGYRTTGGRWGFEVNETSIVEHLLEKLDPTSRSGVGAPTTVEDLVEKLEGLDEPPSTVVALRTRLRKQGSEGWRLVHHIVEPMLPRFVYFENYDLMPGKVAVPHLARLRDEDDLDRGQKALVNLLSMANAGLEDFQESSNHERLQRKIENAGNGISAEVFEYWSQNTDLSVKLAILAPESGAKPPLNEGINLQVRVHNARHGVSVPFDERSRGFVWFFSFLAYFDEIEGADDDRDVVLLLDEPGLSLHGQAQHDLLRLIQERLAPRHQVIYTTHSPFMVSPDHLARVRTVIDHDPQGTQVSAEIFKADEATAAPLLAAMGIHLSRTLFVGPHVLLLEGPSDLIYLDMLNATLGAAGRTTLDPRWVKTPVGGAGKLSTFVTLLGANRLNVAVLVDSSTGEQGALDRLRNNGQLPTGGLIRVGEIVGHPDADIEDLLGIDYYLELVNEAYRSRLGSPIKRSDLNEHMPRVTQRVKQYFVDHDIDAGHLDHYRPAAVLLKPGMVTSEPDDAALGKAEALFERLNALLPD